MPSLEEESDEVREEVEMVMSMYSDECSLVANTAEYHVIDVHLPMQIEVRVEITSDSNYPYQGYPSWRISCSHSRESACEFLKKFNKRVSEEVQLGFPMLAHLISIAEEVASNLQETNEKKLKECKQQFQQQKDVENSPKHQSDFEKCKVEIGNSTSRSLNGDDEVGNNNTEEETEVWAGQPIVDRKSKFLAHMARISSEADVHKVVDALRNDRHLATAHHPAIFAYRFVDAKGIVHLDGDDDGESGASTKMMFLLHQHNVNGYVVIVTRWFGGILLYQDRFRHIMEVTKNMILSIPEHEGNKSHAHQSHTK